MKIVDSIKNSLKRILGLHHTRKLVSYMTPNGVEALRWEQSKDHERKKPTYCILSHSDNFNEVSALMQMSASLQQVQGANSTTDFVFLSAQNSPVIMQDTVLPALHSGDVGGIITPGIWATHAVANEFEHSGLPSPLLFTGVQNINGMQSLCGGNQNRSLVTGIQHRPVNYRDFVAGISDVAPDVRRILLPFDRNITTEELVRLGYGLNDHQRGEFDDHDIRVVPIPVTSSDNLGLVLTPLLREGDGVLISNDTTALVGLNDICQAAQNKKRPVFAENSMAVLRGACLGIGGNGAHDGPRLAHMAYQIDSGMVEKPSQLKIETIDRDHEIRFNARVFKEQGIRMSSEHMRLLNMRSIIAGE